MKNRNVYTVIYREKPAGLQYMVHVIASSKKEAYVIATRETIPRLIDGTPYSAWVESVTYNNGNEHYFAMDEKIVNW